MKHAPAFDFYPERWTHGTRHMTKIERCDYLTLLCRQWIDGDLPADVLLIARILGYRKAAKVSPLIMEKFPLSPDGKRRNTDLESIRARHAAKLPQRFYLRIGVDDYKRIRRRANEQTRRRSIRREVFARCGEHCQSCGSTVDLCLDHIIPVAAGGDSEPSNLQVLCRPCNSRKGCR